MVNTAWALGTVSSQPILKDINGQEALVFNLRTDEKYKDKDGNNRVLEVENEVHAYGKNADFLRPCVNLDDQIYIEGSISSYELDTYGRRSYFRIKKVDLLKEQQ